MREQVFRTIRRNDILLWMISHPLFTSSGLSIGYLVFGLYWFGILQFDFGAPELHERTLQDAHFRKELFFVVFNCFMVFMITYFLTSRIGRMYKTAQEQIQAREEAVSRFEQDFRDLTRKISHDLKAPIRSVQGFSQVLEEDFGNVMDPAAVDYLHRIKSSATRMHVLVTSLVEYARLSQYEVQPEVLDPLALIHKRVLPEVQEFIKRKIQFHSDGPIPLVYADRKLLERTLLEIIKNAGIFCPSDREPVLTLSGSHTPDKVHLSFTDNGIGISPDYIQDVTKVFVRLHPEDLYPGLGIGLAIVNRSMSLMNGSMTITSDGSSGTRVELWFPSPK